MATLTQQQYEALKQRGLTEERIAELAKQKGYGLPTGGVSGIQGAALGVAKGIGKVVVEASKVARNPLMEAARVLGVPNTENPLESPMVTEALTPRGTAENVGNVVANIATFFVPGAKTAQVGGRVVAGIGEGVSKLGIGISAKEAPLIQMYRAATPLYERMANLLRGERSLLKPVTNRETALTEGIAGTESMIGVQAQRGATKLWEQVLAPKLNTSLVKVDMKQFIDEIGQEVGQITELSRRASLQKALQAFADDYKAVGEVSLEQLQKFKEGWAAFLPDKAFRGEPISAAFKEIQNIAAQIARNKIYTNLGEEVKAAYFDYSNLKNLQELGQKALTDSKLKGGAGSFISGIKDMALTPVASTAGLVLYKTGKGLEFVGAAGLKKVREIFGL